jgi:hypothetical protein
MRHSLAIFSRISSLLDIISRRPPTDKIIPWNQWGPAHSRMAYHDIDNSWFCCVHGLKAVVPSTLDGADMEIWDFNPQACRRGSEMSWRRCIPNPPRHFFPAEGFRPQEYNTEADELEIEDDAPRPWYNPPAFSQEIQTSLPYRSQSFTLPMARGRQVCMMTEDCLLVVIVSPRVQACLKFGELIPRPVGRQRIVCLVFLIREGLGSSI